MTSVAGVLAGLLAVLAVLLWPGGSARRARALALGQRRLRGLGAPTRPGPGRPGGWRRSRWWRRRSATYPSVLLPLLDGYAAALRSGLPATGALAVVIDSGPPTARRLLGPVLAAASGGRPTAPAWSRLARAHRSAELALVARSVALSERLGAPLATALTTAALSVRSRQEHDQRLRTATAGARATATLLTALPLGGLGVAVVLGLSPRELYGSLPAVLSLLLGVVVLVLGRAAVAVLVARVGRDRS